MIIQYYSAFGKVNENLANVLNLDIFNASFISDININFGQQETTFKKLYNEILLCKFINNENYNKFIKYSPCKFDFKNLSSVTEDQLCFLASSNILIETDDIAEKLIIISTKAFVIYFENHDDYAVKKINSAVFSTDSINFLINSAIIPDYTKALLLEKNMPKILPTTKSDAENILFILNTRLSTTQLSLAQIQRIISLSSESDANIYFGTNQIKNFEEADIKTILGLLGNDFIKLIDKNEKNAEIYMSNETSMLVDVLKQKGLISNSHKRKKGKITITE